MGVAGDTAERAGAAPLADADSNTWGVITTRLYRSRHMAMPMPPPMHSVASPFLASRLFIS